MSHTERSERRVGAADGQVEEPHIDLRAVVEWHEDDVECTLYPRGATGVELMSSWITAGEESFVDLAAMR